MAGDVDGVAGPFRTGLASACDMDATTGFAALHVSTFRIIMIRVCEANE